METVEESYHFGPLVGEVQITQLRSVAFNEQCLSVTSTDNDATGLRMHAGANVCIRFLATFCQNVLSSSKTCVELGCGTGVVGLAAARSAKHLIKNLILTDGDERALRLATLNAEVIGSLFACHN